jgi:hypothetical protein
MTSSTPDPGSLLTVRAAVVLLLALVVGVLAGGLAYLAQRSEPAAVASADKSSVQLSARMAG